MMKKHFDKNYLIDTPENITNNPNISATTFEVFCVFVICLLLLTLFLLLLFVSVLGLGLLLFLLRLFGFLLLFLLSLACEFKKIFLYLLF